MGVLGEALGHCRALVPGSQASAGPPGQEKGDHPSLARADQKVLLSAQSARKQEAIRTQFSRTGTELGEQTPKS